MIPVIETDAKIKIPGGYLVCIKTGAADDYPGFGAFYSKDGKTANWDDLISVTEYNSTFDNIQTVGYRQGQENYVAAIRFEDGDIIEN